MESGRRAQGCWTCKQRKIGCDRSYPACNNCLRTGRECLGYGIRLAWPDQPDGRRRVDKLPQYQFQLPPADARHYGKQFLNITYTDLALAKDGRTPNPTSLALMRNIPRPQPVIPLIPDIHERESHILNYYMNTLSSMITTIDIRNGFRDEILPMAWAQSTAASDGLRYAMFALAAFHIWGPEQALSYKAAALSSLSASLSDETIEPNETQLATSMMLCVYNVFDEREGNWDLHLRGAKNILQKISQIRGGLMRYFFLHTWFLYHEILGNFTQPLRQGIEVPVSLQICAHMSFEKTLIIGALGCSIEIMEIISYVNGLRALEKFREDFTLSEEEKAQKVHEWNRVANRLKELVQQLDPAHAKHLRASERARILTTAELYRLATCLYLQRTCDSAQVEDIRKDLLEQAFAVLDTLPVCTSPWPLFIIACEVGTDEQRIAILKILDRMDDKRRIGNLFVLRDLIETFWKRQDLQADSGRAANLKWWNVIDLNVAAPWFI